MIYRPIGLRCAVCLEDLELPYSNEQALKVLYSLGFQVKYVDVVRLARSCVGAPYFRGATLDQAPGLFDCSSFTQWLYAQKGIWIPRMSIEQRDYAGFQEVGSFDEISGGDLLFTIGPPDYHWNDPENGVGHVGIATGEGTVIHAQDMVAPSGVVETGLERFIKDSRGIRRVTTQHKQLYTIICPPTEVVESSRIFRWIILHHAKAVLSHS